jgi:CzcA family heavy metal efflux pump
MNNLYLKYKSPLAVFALIILLSGAFAYKNLQTSLFPEITFPKIKIIADAGQMPVNQMMIAVTRPLEQAIKQVPDLTDLRSTTSRGSCEISAFLDWNSNVDLSQQRIESRINQIRNEMPPDVSISVEKMNPSILPVIGYTLQSNTLNPIELKHLALYTIRPFLSQIQGIADVRIIGGKTKEYWVELDVRKMSTLGITPDLVSTILSQTNFVKSNGYIADYRMLYLATTDALIDQKSKLENIVVKNDGKRIVLLKDISAIGIHEAKEYIRINADGQDAILVAVMKQPNTNLVALSDIVQKKTDDLKKLLPAGVTMHPYYVQADFVKESIKSVTDSLWIGLALAILITFIFLRSLRAGLTVLITIPVTLSLTAIVLYATGQSLNMMTIGAIAASIGLIIDDAIVVVEQIHRIHEEQPNEAVINIIPAAIRYIFRALLGSTLSTVVIFIPFLLMSGVAGAYFRIMTNTMIATLLCSFFSTWLILPVIYLLFYSVFKPALVQQQPITRQSLASRVLLFFANRSWISGLLVVVLAGLTYWILPKLETGFLPEMDEGSIVFDYESPAGTSLDETDRILHEVEKTLIQIPEIQSYSRRTGTQMGFYITEPNRGDYLIQLKKNRKKTTDEVISDIRSKVEATQPMLRIDFGQVITDMLGDLMKAIQPVEIKIFGDDPVKLREISKQIAEQVSAVKGTADVFHGIVIAGPSVNIKPDFDRLAQFGITPANFQYQLQTALEGNEAGKFFEPEQLSTIRLVYPGNSRFNVNDISKMQVFLPNGNLKPITELASVILAPGDAEVNRENLQPVGIITARLEQRDLGSVMTDIKKKLGQNINLPPRYYIEYGGMYAEQQKSFNELLFILVAACLLVFVVMLVLFQEVILSLAILFVSLLGVSGCCIALYITRTPLNVGSYTGIIMIVGIIGENAIFTVRQFHEALKNSEKQAALQYAISTRLRPKLMTAFGAIFALLPIALGIGTGAQLHQPLAIAVIGGLIIALPLLLIVLPALLRLLKHEAHTKIINT